MKLIQNFFICVLFVFTMFAMSCAKPPTEEMNSAIDAVARAENDRDAVNFAGALVTRARDALALMHYEADSKRYSAAKSYAAEAIFNAERAITEGRAGASRARDQAAALVSELQPLIEETGKGIDAAKNAGLSLDYDAVGDDFSRAQQDSVDAQLALSGNRYEDAISLSNTVRAELNDINQQLSEAVMAIARKK